MLHLCPLSKRRDTLFCTCWTIGPYLCLLVSLETKCCALNNSWSLWLIVTKLGTLAFFPLQSMWSYWHCKTRGQRPMKNTGLCSEYWLTCYDLSVWFTDCSTFLIVQSYNGGDKIMKSYQFWKKNQKKIFVHMNC